MSSSTSTTRESTGADALREYFRRLSAGLMSQLSGDEILFCSLQGEDSEFVRFNHGRIRQAGSVLQRTISLKLLDGPRQATSSVSITGEEDVDSKRVLRSFKVLRAMLPHLPEDPYLNFSKDVKQTERRGEHELPDVGAAVGEIQSASEGRDLVGIHAQGDVYAGLVSSLGHINWYDTRNFNFDWSFYHSGDKAVKTSYAGFAWDAEAFAKKVDLAVRQLGALDRPPMSIRPGRYPVYLAPAALNDLMNLLGWGSFGLKSLRTRQSPLLRLASGEEVLHEAVTLVENTADGIAPHFEGHGFLRPDRVPLIVKGRHAGSLVSPRSAREYGVDTNGATPSEAPTSLDLAAGELPNGDVLSQLGTGMYVGNIWYLNYSDRAACRTTGMTRFATFWIDGGEVVAPLNVMRFDETLYRMLGTNLVDLTDEREFVLDPSTYFSRATNCGWYPGALVQDFNFTL